MKGAPGDPGSGRSISPFYGSVLQERDMDSCAAPISEMCTLRDTPPEAPVVISKTLSAHADPQGA